eukprot:GDKK01005217.1.p1 GENE.GDKK01005217.1~~GDKK01005217.1.p1  ORF type:complete len:227 (-),score=45.66 GDKK01005217.1:72-719(-)
MNSENGGEFDCFIWSQTFSTVTLFIEIVDFKKDTVSLLITDHEIRLSHEGVKLFQRQFRHQVIPVSSEEIGWQTINSNNKTYIFFTLRKCGSPLSHSGPVVGPLQGLNGLAICWWDSLFIDSPKMERNSYNNLLSSQSTMEERSKFAPNCPSQFSTAVNEISIKDMSKEEISAAQKIFMAKVMQYSCKKEWEVALPLGSADDEKIVKNVSDSNRK